MRISNLKHVPIEVNVLKSIDDRADERFGKP